MGQHIQSECFQVTPWLLILQDTLSCCETLAYHIRKNNILALSLTMSYRRLHYPMKEGNTLMKRFVRFPALGGARQRLSRSRTLALGVVSLLVVVLVSALALSAFTATSHAASTLKAQYMSDDPTTPNNQLKAGLQIVNTGSSSFSLSSLTIRYWFTRDTTAPVSVTCDFASLGCSSITETVLVGPQPTATADTYLQVGFTSGTLAANSNTGKIKVRAWHTDNNNFDQTNDHSFNGSFTSFTDWQNVTLYQNGVLVWGTEPTGTTATATNTPIGPTATNTPSPTATNTPIGPTPTNTPNPTSQFPQAQIDSAVAANLLAFPTPSTSNPRPGDGPTQVGLAKAFYFMALVTWYTPNAKATNGTAVASRLVASINNMVAGGNEPDANGGLEGWGHNDVAQALALVYNDSIWGQLSSSTQSKVNLVMQALAVAANYDFNDANNYKADPDNRLDPSSNNCKFNKTNNPNYREGYVNVMLAASQFFGGATNLNNFLTSFNFTSFTGQLQSAGLTNIMTAWQGRSTLFMSGGSDECGGSGQGVRVASVYQSVSLSNPAGIFDKLAVFTYQDTVISVNGPAHIADNTTSPYQGKSGMEHEFNSSDSGGLRSDALYAYEGWMNSISSRTTLTLLGNWGSGSTQTHDMQLQCVGSGDLLYKLQHGYDSFSLGASRLVTETQPAGTDPTTKGFLWEQQVWLVVLAPMQSC